MFKGILGNAGLTTIVLIYMYVCGALYLTSYWTVFDTNLLGALSISDIPKSFLLPISVATSAIITHLFVMSVLEEFGIVRYGLTADNNKNILAYTSNVFKSMDLLIVLFITCIGISLIYHFHSQIILFAGMIGALLIAIKSTGIEMMRQNVPILSHRWLLGWIFVFTPLFCFVLGKTNGMKVYRNEKIKVPQIYRKEGSMQINAIIDSTTIKFLGFLGDKIIVSSLDNKKIFILNQTNVDFVELTK